MLAILSNNRQSPKFTPHQCFILYGTTQVFHCKHRFNVFIKSFCFSDDLEAMVPVSGVNQSIIKYQSGLVV